MLDIHCHILPGVDDGARSLSESIAMLDAAQKAGITHVVCTPHMRWADFSPEAIDRAFESLLPHAQSAGIELILGYEVNWKKLAEVGLETAPQWVISGTNLFLLEFNDDSMPAQWQRLVKALFDMGLQVVVAHPERYRDIQKNIAIAEELKDLGCYLQLSANFCSAGKREAPRKVAEELLRRDMVDYIASDAHRPEHYQLFTQALALAG